MRLLLFFCGFLLLLLSCTENDPNAQRLLNPPTEDTFDVQSFGVTYLFADTLRVSARLQADHVVEINRPTKEGSKKQETIYYLDTNVKLEFLDGRGNTQSVITSDSAEYDREGGLARLSKDVLMRNQQGETLETEELFWEEDIDSVYTDKRVKIITPDKVIIGRQGLKSNTEFTGYSIFGIEGEMDSPDEQ